MTLFSRILIIIILSSLYTIYLLEIYNNLIDPYRLVPHKNLKEKRRWSFFILLSIIITLGITYTLRRFLLPKPIFDIIVVAIQAIFTISFVGTIFTNLVLHTWHQKRLPYAISIINIGTCAIIGIVTNLLILLDSSWIETIIYTFSIVNDVITVCLILILSLLGFAYWKNIKK